jgi:hypothetical protein
MVKRVLNCWPSSEETTEILEELASLPQEVNAVNRTGPYADRVEDFADSMEGRIAELRTYAQRVAEIEAALVTPASDD